ncbi:HEAT repeat domain-containing protein [Amycolatopsis sp. EV170708-02-1]|uniref:HEAT repeat domain-containing protein n=1 Tax=Amycolatopsis sp. EV170708-02-1 TaxID=2919322 RepID=UPI001F0CA8DA|nr:HEAT repeat domain-containing protein [Amycolatopsis sp. EV170708-02-1]UMP07499.1 HEAT repeat domain-containing protein [Amycolatopsis sp. EV170708-02-1]
MDWSRLEHNYGDASDVPGLLRGCASPDAETASDSLSDLSDSLFHQGGWVCSAASAALPGLVDLAGDLAVHGRRDVVELISWLAGTATEVSERFVDPGWWPALDSVRPRLLALLEDADPAVRRAAISLVADGIRHPESVAMLRCRWTVETDRTTRIDLVFGLGAVVAWSQDEGLRQCLSALLTDDDPLTRLAAVHALAASDPAVATDKVGLLISGVLNADIAQYRESEWIGHGPAALVHKTGSLVLGDPATATAFSLGIARSDDAAKRVAALSHVQQVLSQWRTTSEELLPLLAAHLDDESPEARYRAAALLACVGEQGAPYAEQLIARTTDHGVRDACNARTVGDAAVWALARQHHPGCVPGLVRRLSGSSLGFSYAGSYYDRTIPSLEQPGIGEVLIPLCGHVDALLDAVIARLAKAHCDAILALNLCQVIAAWGPSATAALPVVARFLDDDRVRPSAALAIGALGPAAAGAADGLRRHASEPAAAWALWRTDADPERAVTVLTDLVSRPGLRHTAIALLADLGPEAASCVGDLRTLSRSADDWTRTEAAYALARITGDPTEPVTILTDLAYPLAHGECRPVRIAALCRLADLEATDDRVRELAQAVVDSERRLAYFGGWRTFTEDEQAYTAATTLLVGQSPPNAANTSTHIRFPYLP